MAEETGRRERKKQLTRQALIDAAMRLFEEKGYEQTTVVDITEAADVSDRTFFLHFPTKEDVLLGSTQARRDVALRAVTERRQGDSVVVVLERAAHEIINDVWQADLPSGLAALRVRLMASIPAVQARLLQRLLVVQAELAEAVHKAWPEQLSRTDAAAVVGAVLGALNAATIDSLQQGDQPEQVYEAMRRAVEVALHQAGPLLTETPGR